MRETDSGDGSTWIIVFAAIVLLAVGGGLLFMWQRQAALVAAQQEALMAREMAQVEAERARALAESSRKLAAAMASDSTKSSNDELDQRRQDSRQPQPPSDDEDIEATIRQVLLRQQQAWNEGDIERFMESYWKSDDLTFSSGGKVTRSWKATLDSYRDRYPSREAMGQLEFGNLEITAMGDAAAMVLGQWQLERDEQDVGGNFTLVFRRIGEQWLIIHDHTSRQEN